MEIQLRPLARRASYRYHNSKNSDAPLPPPPPPSSCPRRSRCCPLAFPSAPFPYIIYIKHIFYMYITSPALPTFLFICFVRKPPLASSPASSVLVHFRLATSLSYPSPPLLPSKPPTSLEHRRASSCLIFSPLVSFIPAFFSTVPFPFSTSHLPPLPEHPREYIFLQGS